DSNGFTIDGPRDMWKYRDWVISSMNEDMPFDQFTVEQLAGDMLENPTVDQRVATGFHRNTLANEEGGTDDEQFRNEALVDRVNTTGTVWLGLTIGCSQCHDHKYDPISQRDYYRLFAIFNNTADNNDARGQAPKISLPSAEQSARQAALQAQLKIGKQLQSELEKELKGKQSEWIESLGMVVTPPAWTVTNGNAVSTDGQTLEAIGEGAFVVRAETRPKHDTYQITFEIPEGQKISAIRLETLTHDSLPGKGPGTAGNGNFVLSGVRLKDANGKQLGWSRAEADHSQKGYDVSGAIDDDVKTGWAINVEKGSMNVPRTAVFVLSEPASAGKFTFEMEHRCPPNSQYLIGSFRVSYTANAVPVDSLDDELKSILAIAEGERSDKQRAKLDEFQRKGDAAWVKQDKAVRELQGALDTLNRSIPTSLVMEELPEPRETFIQIRGDFLSHGARVTPGIPAVFETDEADHKTRLDFARWLVSDNQPLTARVTVNRVWQRLFGRGLVETDNDFGLQGTPPSHPELLDWLSSEFMRQQWSLKELKRTIVLSSVYRQSSQSRKDLETADPRNLLLGRQNRVRLDAEIIRDAALTSSGRLTSVLYGPPVHPPQPEGIYVLTQNKKNWPDEKGPNRYRRSLYTYFWRSSPHPMFPTFDAPDATTTCTRRNRSNTPLQALTLANDRGFVELAQGFAHRVLTNASEGDADRIRYAFDVALCREPSDAELQRLQEMLSTARAYFETNDEVAREAAGNQVGSAPDELAETAAWSSVCRVLLNLDEFYTRE
ncbi:MAG: DUF1553 domain-containing protein, partial [Planctomycetaceae bacterium]|nr:DUF1553 domain-containing protein [Planctomycetaceae bacterium]